MNIVYYVDLNIATNGDNNVDYEDNYFFSNLENIKNVCTKKDFLDKVYTLGYYLHLKNIVLNKIREVVNLSINYSYVQDTIYIFYNNYFSEHKNVD